MSTKHILDGWIVLAIDDDVSSLIIIKELTTFCGATTHTAQNGKEGLAKAREMRPDFIITDLSMPVMDGWEMIKQIKADPAIMTIPIIALTAHAMPGDREKAISAGCHNYLSKPLRPDTFANQLMKLLIEIPELAVKVAR